jgi:putative protein kinase ArgK-like GTPase of G3E family
VAQRKKESAPEDSVQAAVSAAVRSQARTLERSSGWIDSTMTTLREQAEGYATLMRSVQTSLQAMEKAINSQAETTRALKESVDAARAVIASATTAHERSLEQAQSFFSGMFEALASQLQVLQAQVRTSQSMIGGAAVQDDMFVKLTQDWLEAYARLIDSALSLAPAPSSGSTRRS